MSLAYKLWKIGNVLSDEDKFMSFIDNSELSDPNYCNINLHIINNKINNIEIKTDAVSKDIFLFTKKMGGAGTGIFYLYPNLKLQKSRPIDKLTLLTNTMDKQVRNLCSLENAKYINTIIENLPNIEKHICKYRLENELELLSTKDKNKFENKVKTLKEVDANVMKLCKSLGKYDKDDYIFWLSINGKSILEIMPEVKETWLDNAVDKNNNAKTGIDFFTNEKCEIGYKPNINVFSYDNYHDSLNYRINDNLSLSKESAKNIKFAWMYILNNLTFYYKGLEYVLIPNLLSGKKDEYRKIIYNLKTAQEQTIKGTSSLKALKKEEERINKSIEKLKKKIRKVSTKKNSDYNKELKKYNFEIVKINTEISQTDLGIIREFNKQLEVLGELKNSTTIDYLFTKINRTNLSFEIKGSIEDVIPSQVSNVVDKMKEFQINDLVTLKNKKRDETYLQEFFNRGELYFALNRSSQSNANKILSERLYLAKLLLTDSEIKFDHLLERFEFNREYNYENKKRVTKDGVKEWLEFTSSFREKEKRIINFLNSLNKIKE